MDAKRILIVEDEENATLLLKAVLSNAGFSRVEHAIDGIQAVRKARLHRPDLILLDLNIPGWHGIDVMKKLKLSLPTARIPIVVVTGIRDDLLRKKLLDDGVAAYFSKPYEAKELVEEVRKILSAEHCPVELKQ